jgi:hypothetical protein
MRCVRANGVIAVYVNLCVAARKYILAGKTADAKNELGDFYNLCTLRPEFDDVDRTDFKVSHVCAYNLKEAHVAQVPYPSCNIAVGN